MWKEKITRLFNANNITIEKVEKPISRTVVPRECAIHMVQCTGGDFGKKSTKTITREIIKESPLGFYYKQFKSEVVDTSTGKPPVVRHWYEIIFNHNGDYYKLKFLIKVGENTVCMNESGLRPWEVDESDHGLSDTMLNELQKQVRNFFDLMVQHKIKFVQPVRNKEYENDKNIFTDGLSWWKPAYIQISQIKDEVYSYLYGNKNGLRVVTDEQKILSHGFDLKTSFRKDKEEKK